VWLHERDDGGVPAPEETTPFRALEVQPNGSVVLYMVGRAGVCAMGSDFTLEDVDDTSFSSLDRVPIVYSVLGLSAVDEVELPFVVAQPVRENCS
jgi:hypothetical protein